MLGLLCRSAACAATLSSDGLPASDAACGMAEPEGEAASIDSCSNEASAADGEPGVQGPAVAVCQAFRHAKQIDLTINM